MFCVNVCSLIYWFGYPIVCCFVVDWLVVVLVWLVVVDSVCVWALLSCFGFDCAAVFGLSRVLLGFRFRWCLLFVVCYFII